MVYAYGADGLLSTKTNARNITTTYGYETVGTQKLPGRLTRLTYSDDTPEVVMSYKRSGELGTVSDAAGLSTFTGTVSDRTVTVTGNGLMTGLLVRRTERGPDQPETVLAQVGGSTVVSNQHAWTDAGLLSQAWQGVRESGLGGSGLRQTWNRNTTTGRLESVTSAAFGSGATHGVSRGYTHGAGGRVEKIWYNAGAVGVVAAGASVQGFDYDHDTHGRREVVRPWLPDSTPAAAEQPPGWKYGYNARGEVEVADRFTAEDGPETGIVGHQRRRYEYDLMGNRDSATQGTAEAEQSSTGYSTNLLQQYDGLTHSRSVEITGQAVAGATVELTLDGGDANAANGGQTIVVDRSLPQHQTGDPQSFRYVHTAAGTAARWLHVQIKASAGGIDLIRQGFVYVPPTNETVAHDDDGNLTEDAQWVYEWDAENRMTSATQKALPVAAGLSATPPARKQLTFAYDYRNRRIAKRVFQLETLNPETWKLVKDLRFVHDGYQMIAELDHTFATGIGLEGSRVTRTFLWGPDVSGTMTGAGGVGGLLSTTYQGVTYQVCSDANGNVTGLVPTSGPGAGQLVARFDYDPFGNRITNTGPDVELCPFGFSTKYTDTETGIVHYELRDYSPSVGLWMSRDPSEERGGINLYGFVGNDAVNRVDLLGLEPLNESDLPVVLSSEEITSLAQGAAIGNARAIYGKTGVVINGEPFVITGTPKPGMRVPKTGTTSILFIYKKNEPNKVYRLDYDYLKTGPNAGKIGWEHNQKGVAKILNLTVTNHQPAGPAARFAGRALTVMKYAGKPLLVLGMINSGLEIYYAENKPRAIVIEAGGWAGAAAGAWLGGKTGALGGGAVGSAFAGVGSVPGAVIGGIGGTIVGGAVGFWGGKKVTTVVVDYYLHKMQAEEWVVFCEDSK